MMSSDSSSQDVLGVQACDEVLDERSSTKTKHHIMGIQSWRRASLREMSAIGFRRRFFGLRRSMAYRAELALTVVNLTAKAKSTGKSPSTAATSGGRSFTWMTRRWRLPRCLSPLARQWGEVFNVEATLRITRSGDRELVHQYVPGAELIVNEHDTDQRNYKVNFAKIQPSCGLEPHWTLKWGSSKSWKRSPAARSPTIARRNTAT